MRSYLDQQSGPRVLFDLPLHLAEVCFQFTLTPLLSLCVNSKWQTRMPRVQVPLVDLQFAQHLQPLCLGHSAMAWRQTRFLLFPELLFLLQSLLMLEFGFCLLQVDRDIGLITCKLSALAHCLWRDLGPGGHHPWTRRHGCSCNVCCNEIVSTTRSRAAAATGCTAGATGGDLLASWCAEAATRCARLAGSPLGCFSTSGRASRADHTWTCARCGRTARNSTARLPCRGHPTRSWASAANAPL
mmetsp:Transcript_68652/g.119238  ORF Transcript_68652/g.119238 Transcript_68652/m.119238 type:complete len:243 (-) Transcript_68652:860-1588(-)